MIEVFLEGHSFSYPLLDVLQLFFGDAKAIEANCLEAPGEQALKVVSRLEGGSVTTELYTEAGLWQSLSPQDQIVPKREVKRQLYLLLSRFLDRSFPWGALTGIRPTLMARECQSQAALEEQYYVRRDKAALALETAAAEDQILEQFPSESLSVYVGIPFCPGRCIYCSFISQEASGSTKLLTPYLEALLAEMSQYQKKAARPIQSFYMGGGTPTVYSDEAFHQLLTETAKLLDFSKIPEITVEAGRPDTITKGKLETMAQLGVQRICLNPQTLNNRTLELLGRRHSREDFLRAYKEARAYSFKTINSDLIAGLPEETLADFKTSLLQLIDLGAENITVHTLAHKRTAKLSKSQFGRYEEEAKIVEEMVQFSQETLYQAGYRPYYLYRQKNTLAKLENTGYTLPGHACSYNVAMMSDSRSVLAFGAGSISKRIFPAGRLERCPNPKDVTEYMARISLLAEKKIAFFEESDN